MTYKWEPPPDPYHNPAFYTWSFYVETILVDIMQYVFGVWWRCERREAVLIFFGKDIFEKVLLFMNIYLIRFPLYSCFLYTWLFILYICIKSYLQNYNFLFIDIISIVYIYCKYRSTSKYINSFKYMFLFLRQEKSSTNYKDVNGFYMKIYCHLSVSLPSFYFSIFLFFNFFIQNGIFDLLYLFIPKCTTKLPSQSQNLQKN